MNETNEGINDTPAWNGCLNVEIITLVASYGSSDQSVAAFI